MEYLARVRDGSTKKLGNGYWCCQVVGLERDSAEVRPLDQELYSQEAPGFVSENDEILKAIVPALTVRDQDLVVREELGFELVSPRRHSLSTFGFVLSEEVPSHSVLAAVSSHDIGFLRSLAGDVSADPDTPVPELHGIMNAELRGAKHCPNSRNHLACPVRKPNHHSGRKTGVPLRSGTMSRISFDHLRPTAPVATLIPGRSGGGAYHSHASAGSDLQN